MQVDFNQIQNDVQETKRLLLTYLERQEQTAIQNESEKLLTVQECADFLHLSKATIYTKISKGELPTIKKQKRCYFLKSELIDYLKKDRVHSFDLIKGEQ